MERPTAPDPRERSSKLGGVMLAVELIRPLVFLGAYVLVSWRWGWMWGAPLAVATILAAALVVHDLIHSSLGLPRWLNTLALIVYGQLIIKSGHALRRVHFEHHRVCLEDEDVEGSPVHMPVWKLLLLGPWLAAELRLEAWRTRRDRGYQILETAINGLLCSALVTGWWLSGQAAPLVYLGCVFAVSVTVPITGVKLPHVLPAEHPWVKRASALATRLTPAASALLFHELHHRRPRIPAALLAANKDLLATTRPSNCQDELGS